jgi:hypothetical protein
MGLDMYLSARRRFYPNSDSANYYQLANTRLLPKLSDNLDWIEIAREVGYWRKANAIHRWFVKHVQDGEDKCRPHYVAREQLIDLRNTCQKVLQDPTVAQELLPTQDGCFFGGTYYDQYYLDDVKQTIAIIERCLTLPEDTEFEYRSSW